MNYEQWIEFKLALNKYYGNEISYAGTALAPGKPIPLDIKPIQRNKHCEYCRTSEETNAGVCEHCEAPYVGDFCNDKHDYGIILGM